MLRIIFSVIKKDLRIFLNYKLNFLLSIFSVFLYTLGIVFFSDSYQFTYGGNPTEVYLYILTGLMVIDMTITCSNASPLALNFYQTSGILDELISNEKRFILVCISSTFIPLFISITKLFFYLFFSYFFFNIPFVLNEKSLFILFFFISYFISVIGISLLASCFTILFKRGNPILQINVLLVTFLGSAFFPVSNIGSTFTLISNFIPAKYMIEFFRTILSSDVSNISSILESFLYLTTLSFFIFSISLTLFKFSLRYTKIKGTTSNY